MVIKTKSAKNKNKYGYEQIVYLLQGGGALGAYQAGLCEKLGSLGFEADWVIGTSIGAIHASIIAGNAPKDRSNVLKKFWQKIALPEFFPPFFSDITILRRYYNFINAQRAIFLGVPGLFKPHVINPWFSELPLEKLSFYDNSDLRQTLKELVNFDRINSKKTRLSLAATQVDTGELMHFDNTKETITIDHIMASAALPPAFPAVKINGKYYWDGGVSANTPLSILMEEPVGTKLLCFMMNLFSHSILPTTATLDDILRIQKNIIYSSHHKEIIRNHYIIQRLRHAIRLLGEKVPHYKQNQKTKALIRLGQTRVVKLIHFHYQGQPADLSSKDYNFSWQSISEHMQSGRDDVVKAFDDISWLANKKEDVGIILHEF